MIVKKIKNLNEKIYLNNLRKNFYSKIFSSNDLVFDIGANNGNRTSVFLDIGAKVIAVEPNPKLVKRLKRKYSKATIVDKAVGGKKGVVTLYLNEADVLSTTSEEWMKTAKDSGRFGSLAEKFNDKVDVEQITINELIEKYGVPKFVKMDTEGTELEIVESINDSKPFSISLEFAIPESKNSTLNSIDYLHNLGYKKFNISLGESMEFISNKNFDYNVMITLMNALPEMSWGDIYVFQK